VSDAELSDIWNLAKWAPTAANTQPLRVLDVRAGQGRDRLVKDMNDGNKAKTASAAAAAVFRSTHVSRAHPYAPPTSAGDKGRFERVEEMRAGTGTFNASLQVGYFILQSVRTGFAAEPMAGFDADFFPNRWHSRLVVDIGHPFRIRRSNAFRASTTRTRFAEKEISQTRSLTFCTALSKPRNDLVFRSATPLSSSRKEVST
jgi:3-hydroxypropanoate dehydrogenase